MATWLLLFACILSVQIRCLQATCLGASYNEIRHKMSEDQAIGVGFDLTGSYGTAAISYPNGTILPVARVNASVEYHEVMERLSLHQSQHPSPPYQDWDDSINDQPRQWLRKMRKDLGLPASNDVAALVTVVQDLREKTEEFLGHSISAVSAAVPHMVAIYEEDIVDAFEYVGLEFIDVYGWGCSMLYETTAVYAGYNFGLCSDYTDPVRCREEWKEYPGETVLNILYTKDALTVAMPVMTGIILFEPRYRYLCDFALGNDARSSYPGGEDIYWQKVRNAIQYHMVQNPYYPKPSKILLFGESIHDEKFNQVLEESLDELMDERPKFYNDDSDFVVAKGAAELSKRQLWNIHNGDKQKLGAERTTDGQQKVIGEQHDGI